MTQALDDAAQRVSRYLLMQVLVNAGFGVLFGFGLYCIGVPIPAMRRVMAGLEITIANFVEPWLYGPNSGISSRFNPRLDPGVW